jgi:anti-anti-sigma factor
MRLRIDYIPLPDEMLYLCLTGELILGLESTGKLRNALSGAIGQEYRTVILDMSSVRKIDAAGLGVLVEGFAAGERVGTHVRLLNVSRQLFDLLTLTKLISVFGLSGFETTAKVHNEHFADTLH